MTNGDMQNWKNQYQKDAVNDNSNKQQCETSEGLVKWTFGPAQTANGSYDGT
jgi:hypothetical protein